MDHKRAVIYKKRRVIYQSENETSDRENTEEEDEDEEDIEDSPYDDIKLDDLLAPIESPEQIVTHPAISRTYTSNTLKYMSMRALDIINQEQEHVVKLAKLMSAFLGDDPSYLLADKLNLPQYNETGEEEDEFVRFEGSRNGSVNGGAGNTGTSAGIASTSSNGLVKTEDPSLADKRITRTQSTMEIDPFFALPQINIDQNFGILPENAEETRQLTQIAQQRMEEFIRCMTNVRSGLLRADRYRNKVYLWCQQMNGGDELPESIVSDPLMKKKPDPDATIAAAEAAEVSGGNRQ
ncbi:Rxt2p [Sugiyamaella lignohabitans]|uniref:Rxt2p n=1 Tax=Sugiyamaella lignohabitans TaxID=796027 RepID=A0A161HIB5_9ASCO|nr:Rxt2p [Sugiyamaella lignohabitans]ANB16030.1 Rxt2p [Sugiyamaella lignohabitans]